MATYLDKLGLINWFSNLMIDSALLDFPARKIERLTHQLPVQFVVSDILYYKGRDVTDQPL
jgi:hypothetical protein